MNKPRDRTEYCQNYYQQHRDKLLSYQKKYYQTNHDKLKQYQRNYNKNNLIECPCGITTTKNYIEQHRLKKIHINRMTLLNTHL